MRWQHAIRRRLRGSCGARHESGSAAAGEARQHDEEAAACASQERCARAKDGARRGRAAHVCRVLALRRRFQLLIRRREAVPALLETPDSPLRLKLCKLSLPQIGNRVVKRGDTYE